jgi:hypothetical protein
VPFIRISPSNREGSRSTARMTVITPREKPARMQRSMAMASMTAKTSSTSASCEIRSGGTTVSPVPR